MKQKKFERIRTTALFFLVMVSLVIFPVRADEEYQIIVTLQAPEPKSLGRFGVETTLFEGGLIVGTNLADVGDIGSAGKAYIYDSNWVLTTTIPSPTPREAETFGKQLDAYGDRIVISNDRATIDGLDERGAVFLFDTDGSLILELQMPVPGKWQQFGAEVSLGKEIILVAEVGGIIEEVPHGGIVHAYDDEGGFIRSLISPSIKPEGTFGWSLAVSDEFMLIGEPGNIQRGMIPESCSVYVYDYDWNHVATLNAPDQMKRTAFGISTSTSRDYIVVGEPWATVDGHEKAGRAHIFDTEWNHIATLQSPTPEAMAEFGYDVVVGGDIVVVGERKGDVDVMNEGKAHVFDLEGDLISTLVSPEPFPGNQFGYSVETDGEIIVVCEADVEAGGVSKAGKVHVFGLGEPIADQPIPEEETTEESEPESESEKSGGIPGFPVESVVISLALVVLILYLALRQR